MKVLIRRLLTLLADHTFPSEISAIPALSSLYPGTAQRNPNKEALNCLRVLARVLPVVFEGDADHGRVEEQLWLRTPKKDASPAEVDQPKQFVIDDEDEDDGPKSPTTQPNERPTAEAETEPSLGEKLVNVVLDLMFCCGFTIPKKVQVDHHKINYMIWVKGIGSTSDIGTSRDLESNKTEVLREILSFF